MSNEIETATAPQVDTPEPVSEYDALSAAFDKAQEADETPETEVVEAVDDAQPDEEPEAVEEPVEDTAEEPEKPEEVAKAEEAPPSDLSKEIRDAWADMPQTARDAVVASQRALSSKLREQGNLMQGIAPIRDVLVQATKDMPALASMKPEQVATEMLELAQMSQKFQSQPVETMMGLIEKHGLADKISQALQGQPVRSDQTITNLQQTVAQQQRQIAELTNPEHQAQIVQNALQEQRVVDSVQKFTESITDWDSVEAVMPAFVQAVQARNETQGIVADPLEVMQQAYALAKGQTPEAGQAEATPEKDVVSIDPQRTEAAKKAKSVNVSSRPTGRAKKLTEEELLGGVFDRMQAS